MFLWGRSRLPDSGWDLPLEKGITLALFQHYLNQVCPVREWDLQENRMGNLIPETSPKAAA